MKKRLEAKVWGSVQGVNFRDLVKRKAEHLKLNGWVRNESDGTMSVVAEGDEEHLRTLLNYLYRGPVGAHVDKVDVVWADPKGERYFNILYE